MRLFDLKGKELILNHETRFHSTLYKVTAKGEVRFYYPQEVKHSPKRFTDAEINQCPRPVRDAVVKERQGQYYR